MSLKAAINIMDKKNFYFLGTNLFRNNAFFVSKDFNKEKFFKDLKVNDIHNSTDANFTESRDENGNLNYLKSKKRIEKILECEVVDLTNYKNKIVKLKSLLLKNN